MPNSFSQSHSMETNSMVHFQKLIQHCLCGPGFLTCIFFKLKLLCIIWVGICPSTPNCDFQSHPLSSIFCALSAGVEDLLSTLHHIRSRLNSADNTSSSNGSHEVFFLKQLFHNQQFQQAVAVHQKVVEVTSRMPQPQPQSGDGQDLVMDISTSMPARGSEATLRELVTLLHRPLVKVRLENPCKSH